MMVMNTGLLKLGLAQEHRLGEVLAPGRTWAQKLSQTAKLTSMETGCWSH
jgi:hypothetical protein